MEIEGDLGGPRWGWLRPCSCSCPSTGGTTGGHGSFAGRFGSTERRLKVQLPSGAWRSASITPLQAPHPRRAETRPNLLGSRIPAPEPGRTGPHYPPPAWPSLFPAEPEPRSVTSSSPGGASPGAVSPRARGRNNPRGGSRRAPRGAERPR